jgi:hypothetical protein
MSKAAAKACLKDVDPETAPGDQQAANYPDLLGALLDAGDWLDVKPAAH